ncbi:hypothetical protein [Nocardia cyriacigeorgica]|uniref:hypothetical protein n=1 Tax=Nocardia cyriacigeorgica TaxID=135487 RepID=UPI002458ACAA|nr:hypothetical protein [Nocardia cyriacigeorgica]
MASDRDTLAYLILDCVETLASPSETADYLIERGWRPPARVIETAEELDALPNGTIIRDADGDVFEASADGRVFWATLPDSGWHTDHGFAADELTLPAVVLWEPEQEARR